MYKTLQNMNVSYPHLIENCVGEKIIFEKVQPEQDGDRLIVSNSVSPGHGPVMHTHWLQDECLTVVKGRMGYQVEGQPEQYAGVGETVLFKKGTPHRFWNADDKEVLQCQGWVKPANTLVFFLSSIYAAQNKTGSARPEPFDSAYLMTRYASEYDLTEIPGFVKKVIMPFTYHMGRLLGKYKHFKNAPTPLKA